MAGCDRKFLFFQVSSYFTLGFRSQHLRIWGSTTTLWRGSGTKARKGLPFFPFSDSMWSLKITKYLSKNQIILTQFITLGHCSAHWHLWWLLVFEIHSSPLLDDENVSQNTRQDPACSKVKKCACTPSSDHPGLLEHCEPSSDGAQRLTLM